MDSEFLVDEEMEPDPELNRITKIVQKHEIELSKAWHYYFKGTDGNGSGTKRTRH